jgi:serine/threonine protein kinase
MAIAYKAYDTHLADLAIKILRPHLAKDNVFLHRFKREAQTLADLHQPICCELLWMI